jgi:hypothetical protein
MTLLNDPASLPLPMWAVVRFLMSAGGQCQEERARVLLSPASLLPDDRIGKDVTFANAVRTLRDLGLITSDTEILSLTPPVRELASGDLAGFSDLMRKAVLDPGRNAGISENEDQTGPKDLVRALAWFLTCDAFTPLGLAEVTQLQQGAFASRFPNPIVNDFRWNRFVYWAPALGFTARPPMDPERAGQRLVPDCTAAVRRVILATWRKGQRVDAADVVDRIAEELPVLPGGQYSRSLGLHASLSDVSSSLSFALLCGHDQGWISLGRRSDAPRDVLLTDPDIASGFRRVSELTILGSLDD